MPICVKVKNIILHKQLRKIGLMHEARSAVHRRSGRLTSNDQAGTTVHQIAITSETPAAGRRSTVAGAGCSSQEIADAPHR